MSIRSNSPLRSICPSAATIKTKTPPRERDVSRCLREAGDIPLALRRLIGTRPPPSLRAFA